MDYKTTPPIWWIPPKPPSLEFKGLDSDEEERLMKEIKRKRHTRQRWRKRYMAVARTSRARIASPDSKDGESRPESTLGELHTLQANRWRYPSLKPGKMFSMTPQPNVSKPKCLKFKGLESGDEERWFEFIDKKDGQLRELSAMVRAKIEDTGEELPPGQTGENDSEDLPVSTTEVPQHRSVSIPEAVPEMNLYESPANWKAAFQSRLGNITSNPKKFDAASSLMALSNSAPDKIDSPSPETNTPSTPHHPTSTLPHRPKPTTEPTPFTCLFTPEGQMRLHEILRKSKIQTKPRGHNPSMEKREQAARRMSAACELLFGQRLDISDDMLRRFEEGEFTWYPLVPGRIDEGWNLDARTELGRELGRFLVWDMG